jgi:predicted short-subunit dehydrogenase-like oxidoreductase (DUF2520 family)
MKAKPRVAIIGAGRWGTSLVTALDKAGYKVAEIVVRHPDAASRALARRVRARLAQVDHASLHCEIVWFCVPDSAIAFAAARLRDRAWTGRVALHSSGALPSGELSVLQARGARIASVHPLMTFAGGKPTELAGVPFALEGDAPALRIGQQLVRAIGGQPFVIAAAVKPLYHAWGSFLSPLLVAYLACAEEVAGAAGLPSAKACRNMLPIVLQTIHNYALTGAGAALTGPLTRGDLATIRGHLRELRRFPDAERVYRALSLFAVHRLPVKDRKQLERLMGGRARRVSAK